jgi:N-acetylglucosamine-6-phosphate deacetylase
MLAFTNGRVLANAEPEAGLAVLVQDGRILDVVPDSDPAVGTAQRHDLHGDLLLPGFIDTQVNGGGDVLFNDAPTVDSVRRIAAAHARHGTTGLLPTLISDELAVMRRAVEAVDAAIAQQVPGILGIHLEGPFLSTQRRGVHEAAKIRAIDAEGLAVASALRRGRTLLTLAPEQVDPGTIRELCARGVIVAAGHTAGSYEQVRTGLAAGIRGFTHLFNAMTPLTSREPGAVGAALDDADSWCGLIVDGHHAHPASLRVAIRAKARGKMMLVTDAMPPVGGVSPEFQLGGQTAACRDGICLTLDGTLAGSCLDMAGAVRNSVRMLGLSLGEAVRMASAYPAAFLGLGATHGRIAPGYQADFVVADEDLQVRQTWIGGGLMAGKAPPARV